MQLPASLASAEPEVAFPRLTMPRLELCFTDGSMLWLRQLKDDPMQRSFDYQGEELHIDLTDLAPYLHHDVYTAPELDRPATIFFTLRHSFKTAEAFVQAVRACSRGKAQVCA